jgi:hypothetical protein
VSDFLSRLLGRAVHGAPVLRPRPLSLFESPRGTPVARGGGAPEWPAEQHTFADPPQDGAPPPSPIARAALSAAAPVAISPPEPAAEVPAVAPTPVSRQISSAPRSFSPVVSQPIGPAPPDSRSATSAGASVESPPVGRRVRRKDVRGSARRADTGADADAEARREPPRAVPAIARSIAPAAPAAVLAQSPRAPVTASGDGPARKTQPVARPAPSRSERPSPRAQRRLAAAPPPRPNVGHTSPTVQVTIGRLEVRATRPAAAPERRAGAPAGPKLGLDEYLRSRGEGQR